MNQPIIQQILQRIDFIDFVNQYTTLNSKNFGLCPFHPEKHPSFNIEPVRMLWYCFSCGRGGNLFKFVMLREGLTFKEALKYLAEYLHIGFPRTEREALAIRQKCNEEKSKREVFNKEVALLEDIARRIHMLLCEEHRLLLRKRDKTRGDYTQLLVSEHKLDLCDQYYSEIKEIKRNV